VPVGEAPTGVSVAPDGQTVWVGNDGDDTVSVLDGRSHQVRKTVRVGRGHHEVAFADNGRTAWITSRESETAAAVDTTELAVVAEVAVGEGAASVAASDAAGAVYVANEARGEVVLVDAQRRAVSGRVAAQRGVSTVRFEPKGRFAFALNPARDEVSLIDGSTGRLAHTLSGLAAPDAIAFTPAFAYVRSLGANRVSLIDLPSLERPGAPSVVEIQVGERAPGSTAGGRPGAPIAPLPQAGGAIVASPADKALYYYAEGMMAPIGTFSNYGRAPGSALIEDRTLKEVEPGVYATTVRPEHDGTYDVELLLGGRKIAACLEASVARSPDARPDEAAGVTLEPLFDEHIDIEVSRPVTLRFRVTPKGDAAPLDAEEVNAMIIRFPTGFRWTGAPRLEADGAFSVTFTPPRAGEYRFFAAAAGRGALLGALPSVRLEAHEPGEEGHR
jgi:YVTN family beta-propeller protein